MRALVCGGRDFKDHKLLHEIMDLAVVKLGITSIIHGGARGADLLAKEWADSRGIPEQAFPALWYDIDRPGAVVRTRFDGTKFDVLAGFHRNQHMIDIGKPNFVFAFPGGRGTDDMARRAMLNDIPVFGIKSK
jgi:hypothetical protein